MGALWTPGYWGFYGGRYSFYPGYWGLHIGFYGGINYGFGYIGFGYEGGYWNSGHFFYNRAYNHIDTRVVHNVYNYNAGNRARVVSRASFNGGARGVQVRPRSSEMAARREPTAPRMSTQVQHARTYSTNRGQLATQNHGRPATPAISRGIPADRNVKPSNRSGGGGQAEREPSVTPRHSRVFLSSRACASQDVTPLACGALLHGPILPLSCHPEPGRIQAGVRDLLLHSILGCI